MFSIYYRAKRWVAFALGAFFLGAFATTELGWATSYVETRGTVAAVSQKCAEGRSGPIRYVDCSEALPSADRRTVLTIDYLSPADRQEHKAAVRCDTSASQTPGWSIGDPIDLLAHKKEPETIDRRRCVPVASSDA